MTPSSIPPSARRSGAQPLRLVGQSPDAAPPAVHPLTTLATSLLPPRDAVGARADVWEELDRAAAWVCDHWGSDAGAEPGAPGVSDRDVRRQALRVLCVAARSADAMPRGDGAPALRPGDLPWNVPVPALVGALRQRLVSQTVAAESTGSPAADPSAVLRVVAALDRLGEVARADSTRTIVDQLTGAGALDLLVEVAHDMRSPLASILFLVERLRDAAGDAAPSVSEQRQLALVYGAAFGLASMVGDVMELARGGDRLASGEPAALALPEIVEGVCAIVRPLAEEKGLALEIGAVPRETRVGHAAGVQRVLLNLVTNALKYTPSGTVRVEAAAVGGSRVRFTITDTGRGIPPQVLANLFQAFRPRATHDFAFSSAGLGLAICQKLVAAMGGTLEVDSEAERGTTFRVELPLPLASLL